MRRSPVVLWISFSEPPFLFIEQFFDAATVLARPSCSLPIRSLPIDGHFIQLFPQLLCILYRDISSRNRRLPDGTCQVDRPHSAPCGERACATPEDRRAGSSWPTRTSRQRGPKRPREIDDSARRSDKPRSFRSSLATSVRRRRNGHGRSLPRWHLREPWASPGNARGIETTEAPQALRAISHRWVSKARCGSTHGRVQMSHVSPSPGSRRVGAYRSGSQIKELPNT